MKNLDLRYLCTIIGNLSGIPIRIYENRTQLFYYSTVMLPKDPFTVYQEEVWSLDTRIGYYATEQFHYYGIVCSDSAKIIIGPTRQVPDTEQVLRDLAFRADVTPNDLGSFLAGMNAIVCMPLESMLQILCTLHYVLNDEKKSLEDITIYDSEQENLKKLLKETVKETPPTELKSVHNTYDLEQSLMDMVRRGDFAALKDWISSAPAIRGGILAPDQLRQRKNTFIVTATLASRAAIRGGMAVEDAFRISDAYIQKCELLHFPDKITNLQYRMILDFTWQVGQLRHGKQPTKLVLDVVNYIRHHMSDPISVEEMARQFYMSRPYLSRKFRQEAGETLTDFILKEKTAEAKRLLCCSDKPLSAISSYLGFSSQSHFSRVFKKYTSVGPGEYREAFGTGYKMDGYFSWRWNFL